MPRRTFVLSFPTSPPFVAQSRPATGVSLTQQPVPHRPGLDVKLFSETVVASRSDLPYVTPDPPVTRPVSTATGLPPHHPHVFSSPVYIFGLS